MPATITAAHRALLTRRTLTYATCWTVLRVDGTAFRFTDHDAPLSVDGTTFQPAGGFNASARQTQIGLRTRNLDVVGVISTNLINSDDIRAGLYREAKITERVVDWRCPWLGAYIMNRYWISEITYTEQRWEAKVDGVTRWLRQSVGENYTRFCRHDLGDDLCTIDLGPFTTTGTVTAIVNARYRFQSNLVAVDDWYKFGLLTWLTGNNADFTSEVGAYLQANGEIRVYLATPYDIQVGDTFEVYAGCDKKLSTCRDKFNNVINFGGFPDIPGTDKMIQTPRAK